MGVPASEASPSAKQSNVSHNLRFIDIDPPVVSEPKKGMFEAKDYAAGGGREARMGRNSKLRGWRWRAILRKETLTMTTTKDQSGMRIARSSPDADGGSGAHSIATRQRAMIHLRVPVRIALIIALV